MARGPSRSQTRLKPYLHLAWTDCLDPALYKALDENWPAQELWRQARDSKGRDLQAPYDKLPQVWQDFIYGERHRIAKAAMDAIGFIPLEGGNNHGRFMERVAGYHLKSHVDLPYFLATFVMYFPYPEQVAAPGASTNFFGPKMKPSQVPYTPNTLVAWQNGPHAWHEGAVPEDFERPRRVYQWHWSLKPLSDNFGV